MNATMRRFAPIIAIIIGIVFIAVGVVKYSGTVSGSKTRTEVAEGTVVGLEEMESQDSDGYTDYTYAPVIEFFDTNGTKHEVVSPLGEEEGKYEVGQSIKVHYDPADPEGNFMPDGAEGTIKLITIGLIVAGVVILFGSVLRIIRGVR